MRNTTLFLASSLLLLHLLRLGVYAAEDIPFTSYHKSIPLRISGKEYVCATHAQIRFVPDGNLFKTDFLIDSDLRSIYLDLANILSDMKKDNENEYIRLYNVTRNFNGINVTVKSKIDLKEKITSDLKLEQSVESVVSLFPEYSGGTIRLNYEILEAKFDGMAKSLPPAAAKHVLTFVFDALIQKKMEYRLPEEFINTRIEGSISFVPKDGNFYGVKAQGSAWLTPTQFNLLLKRLSERAS